MLWNYLLNNFELLEQLEKPVPDFSVENLTKFLKTAKYLQGQRGRRN
ncbi:MAG: hypothetical protein CM1200mP28_16950 [Deltaproteobacteria bacterium]|nr:MAG: hypothetical protein CM1200mP28_16950 [Deltaproteobacteria bacterium]